MKVEVNESKTEKKIEFPCLMIHEKTGNVIIATGKTSCNYIGVMVNQDELHGIGRYSETWVDTFKPFKGSITLSND